MKIKKLSKYGIKQSIEVENFYLNLYIILMFISLLILIFGINQVITYNNYWVLGFSLFTYFLSLIYAMGFYVNSNVLINRLELREINNKIKTISVYDLKQLLNRK